MSFTFFYYFNYKGRIFLKPLGTTMFSVLQARFTTVYITTENQKLIVQSLETKGQYITITLNMGMSVSSQASFPSHPNSQLVLFSHIVMVWIVTYINKYTSCLI